MRFFCVQNAQVQRSSLPSTEKRIRSCALERRAPCETGQVDLKKIAVIAVVMRTCLETFNVLLQIDYKTLYCNIARLILLKLESSLAKI